MVTFNMTAGQDYVGDANIDNVYGSVGNDIIDGGAGNDNLRGGDGNDTLLGGEGNDFLDGGEGTDRMIGGEGNDTYVVDNISDVVIEEVGGGVDTVKSFIDYTLRPNVENLELQGLKDLNGSGNALSNTLKGNSGNNSLFGWGGNDSINGGAGDDVINGGEGNDYLDGGDGVDIVSYKDAAASVIINLSKEKQALSGAGQDTLKNFENLEGSAYDDVLTGNASANKIAGLDGNDHIRGGAGNDQLFGGQGEDQFIFNATGDNGVDYIRDFTSGVDKLVFFASDGYDDEALFVSNAQGIADGAGAQFVYNTKSHSLSYDADGSGGVDAVLLAHFAPSVVQSGDILVS
ncbi:calcium-binding protein [Rhizobium sp. XQZ8]|uniref:calcium-binding protein n=1 Tax=Rhizobium populisoli TaxID=2859785 RepID=UPI001CA4BE3D|nr:calcium-binding protein [Rhizobium populisoli]MBW6426034.1 calcium-binding protein [Rhizobium populisoli]